MKTPDAWPTEDLATKAVDAAAKDLYERSNPGALTPWDDLDATIKLEVRQAVLPIVWAALQNLPDPRYAAFEEGYNNAWYNWTGDHAASIVNPYPSGI